MLKIPISEFKATCLAVLEGVRKTKQPVLITRFGKPVAEVVAPSPERAKAGWMGCMRTEGTIVGDIVGPAVGSETWESLSS